jgi:hypothetical protein
VAQAQLFNGVIGKRCIARRAFVCWGPKSPDQQGL